MTLRSVLGFFALAACIITAGCGPATHAVASKPLRPSVLVFEEPFETTEAVSTRWFASLPEVAGAAIVFEDGAARLVLPSKGEIALLHVVDAASVRGKRVRISARVRTDTLDADAHISFGSSVSGFMARTRTRAASLQGATISRR